MENPRIDAGKLSRGTACASRRAREACALLVRARRQR